LTFGKVDAWIDVEFGAHGPALTKDFAKNARSAFGDLVRRLNEPARLRRRFANGLLDRVHRLDCDGVLQTPPCDLGMHIYGGQGLKMRIVHFVREAPALFASSGLDKLSAESDPLNRGDKAI